MAKEFTVNPDDIAFQNFRPASGRWYGIIKSGDRFSMERVIGWVDELEDGRPRGVTPVTTWGVRMDGMSDGEERIHCVAGEDAAPDGRSWADVFNDLSIRDDGCRDVTSLIAKARETHGSL